jgi:hypothetical protein
VRYSTLLGIWTWGGGMDDDAPLDLRRRRSRLRDDWVSMMDIHTMTPGGRRMPRDFDKMVAPRSLPNDRNSYMPEDVMRARHYRDQPEDI